jgi:agmatine/peptidylarginine deiminase
MTALRTRLFPLLALCVLCALATTSLAGPVPGLAQEAQEWDVDGHEPLLPRHETEAERLYWQSRLEQMPGRELRSDPPPVGPVRNCAEWEPCQGVLIRYPLGLPYGLLRDLDDDVTLYVVVSSGYQSSAQSALSANGVDMSRVEWVVRNNDSIWTRDYGPWFVFDGDGDIGIVDHTYNRPWRPNDNLIPVYVAQQLGIPSYSHDMYHTGGNYMTDGAHVSASTRLVYDEAASENGMTPTEVDQLMLDYYGIASYQVLQYIESGGIHHIDTWAKFLDEETVLVKDVWPSHWTYDDLNQRATLLASLESSTGRNYQVHRVYCHDIGGSSPASYTNSLILNDDIYVPTFGNGTYDEQALAAYREAAPGYTVRGYYYGGFLSDDALHCRTKGIMDLGMLRVGHVPVVDEQPLAPVTVTATVRPHSGAALTDARLVYRHDGGPWQEADLASTGADWEYTADIAAPTAVATCEYYVTASDASGRTETYPRVAPARTIAFQHGDDVTAAGGVPGAVSLAQNHPNPFNPATTFAFDLHHAGHAELVVLDARGRRVRTLIDRVCAGGTTEVVWDGTDDAGRRLPSGTYVYRLRAAGLQYTKAATLVK